MGKSLEFYIDEVHTYRNSLWKYVCFNDEGAQDINVPFESFRPFGFIDCMGISTSAPASGPINEEGGRDPMHMRSRELFLHPTEKMGYENPSSVPTKWHGS